MSGFADFIHQYGVHKMVISASQEAKRNRIPIARVHTSSACALHQLLGRIQDGGVDGVREVSY